jgi:hypothetical protein
MFSLCQLSFLIGQQNPAIGLHLTSDTLLVPQVTVQFQQLSVQWQAVQELLQYVVLNLTFLYCLMDGYPFNVLADMHLTYGCANGSVQRAACLCQEHSHTDAI